ncbi:hypothetical protein GF352_04615 [archaeon]|nr:hypothetical protein [archaeon]
MKKGYINWSMPPAKHYKNYAKKELCIKESTPKYRITIKEPRKEQDNLFNQVLRFETLDKRIINGTFNKTRRVR